MLLPDYLQEASHNMYSRELNEYQGAVLVHKLTTFNSIQDRANLNFQYNSMRDFRVKGIDHGLKLHLFD
jgi:hypothetical protein